VNAPALIFSRLFGTIFQDPNYDPTYDPLLAYEPIISFACFSNFSLASGTNISPLIFSRFSRETISGSYALYKTNRHWKFSSFALIMSLKQFRTDKSDVKLAKEPRFSKLSRKTKARRKIASQCPPLELELAREIFEREASKKKDKRREILLQRREHQSSRKRLVHQNQPQAKRQKMSPQNADPKQHKGKPQGAKGKKHPQRPRQQPRQSNDKFVRAGWRQQPQKR
jgi:hypothetical protein